jgi:CRISPR-associated protein Csx14
MTTPPADITIDVDLRNPGHFFACCGLLELASRLWPGSEANGWLEPEGWFDVSRSIFVISSDGSPKRLACLMEELIMCNISGLSEKEDKERKDLEGELRRQKKKGNGRLSPDKEQRRKELGELARKGTLRLEAPFNIVLNWWQTGDDDATTPKTWAGLQELHKVARSAQDALKNFKEIDGLLDHGSALHMPPEYCKVNSDSEKTVEPFYFDARRFAHALDVGFSLDVQDAETVAHPAVELLSLIGLQRFRPMTREKWEFEYAVWVVPLPVAVASAVASCAIPVAQRRYRFRLRFRDDQRRYKAFDFATPVGERP